MLVKLLSMLRPTTEVSKTSFSRGDSGVERERERLQELASMLVKLLSMLRPTTEISKTSFSRGDSGVEREREREVTRACFHACEASVHAQTYH